MDLRKMYKDSRGVAGKMLNPTGTAINWGVGNTQRLQEKKQAPTMNNYKSNLNLTTYDPRYPGFDEEDYKKLEQGAINRGLTGEEKTQFMDEAYQYYYPQVLNQHGLDKRAEQINKTASENGSAILNGNKQAEWNMKLIDLAQTAKRVKGFAYDYPDEQIIDAMKTEIPDGEQLLLNYLNDGDDTILYKAGLKKTEAQVKVDEYNKRKENINKALVENWKELSEDGLKYLRDYNVMFQTVDEARQEGLGQGMSDNELLLNLIYLSPELQQLEKEINGLKLNNEDLAILGETTSVKADEWNQTKNNFRDWIGWNSDKPATINDIDQAIYVKQNGGIAEDWKNFKANLRNRGDSMEKVMNRFPKDFENFMNEYLPTKNVLELEIGKELSDEEYDKLIEERKLENIRQVQAFDESLNKEIQASRERIGLDPIIEDYYSKQGIVESLFNGNGGAGYKLAGDVAGNRDMALGVLGSAVNPGIGLFIMGTDTFTRENQESFDNLINAQTKQGISYEDAYDNASKGAVIVGAVNTAIELGLEKFLGGVETTAGENIKKIITQNLNKEVSDMVAKRGIMEMLGKGLETQARSSLEEGLEEVFQQLVQNIAASGVDPNQEISEGLRQAFESGALNPMNLLAGGSELLNSGNLSEADKQTLIESVNKNQITQGQSVGVYNPKNIVANIQYGFTNPPINRISNPIYSQMTSSVANETSIPTSTPTTIPTNTPTNTQGNTTVGNTVTVDKTTVDNNGDKATFKEELYSIDPTLKKNLQNNPYTAEVWEKTQDYIDKNGRPERSNDVAKALIVDVADKVQEKLVEKMEEGGKNGKLYQTIDNAGFTVDLTELKDGLDEILEGYGIEIEEKELSDGTTKTVLNFDKTAIDGSEASNIRKIYNWLQNTNAPMSEKEFRTRFKQAMKDMVDFNPNNKDQAGRRRADTPGDKVIKGIMKKANDLAHAQIPELAELDEIYSEWIDIMDEVSDGLVYKDAAKRGVIKDNVYQIIKNLDEPSRRQMVNRLEKLIPGIKDEVNAINQMPKVIDHIYKPSKLQQGLTSEGVKTVGAIGGLPGYLLAKWGGEGIAKLIDSQKSKAWNEVLQETSEEGKAKMAEIQAKIEANQKLSQEQEARLQGLKDRLLEKMATVEKTDAEQSAWESWLADLEQDEVIDMPEEVYDQWEEVTTTPKKKTSKKKISKRSTKLDTKKIASDYMKGDMDWNKYQHLAGLTEEQALEKRGKFEAAIDEEWDKNQDYYNTHQSELVDKFHHLLDTSKRGLDKNQASSKTAKVEIENNTVKTDDGEVVNETEIETLPADVSIEKEAKQVGEKRIAPDRVPRQQLTFDEGVNKINNNLKTVAEYMKLRSEFYTAGNYNDSEMKHRLNTLEKEVQQILYGENGFNFQSTRSKEFNDLWKNITDNRNNPVALREVARNFYISKVKKDISKGYQFPIEVLEKIPGAEKALNARERYQKGLDTSFSAKDARIDYSEQDKIGAGIKSQDGKQVTKEQKEDIVKGIEDFGRTLGLDMKKFAEDRGLVYVHLHGGHPFLSTFGGMYREATNNQGEKNISVSVGGSENVRYKDPKTKERKTNKLNTTMSHELGHAMDYLIDNRLFSWEQKSMLRSKFNPVNRLREYYAKGNEIVARAIEQYVAVENGQPNYYLENGNLDAGEFKGTDLEYALKEVGSYYERPGYWSKPDYEKYVKPYVEEAFKNNFKEYKTAKK